jgi:uncharacterized protein (DUF1697 family)
VALVVLLRGINVGGHRRLQPAVLAKQLQHLGASNIGAAGTFVIRKPISRARLRAEFTRRLPFDPHVIICDGHDIARLAARDFFAGYPVRRDIIRFVSVLSRKPRVRPALPLTLPETGPWLVKALATDGPFVIGLYRRQMKAIGWLGKLDQVFGAAATTRNWNTIIAIKEVLDAPPESGRPT